MKVIYIIIICLTLFLTTGFASAYQIDSNLTAWGDGGLKQTNPDGTVLNINASIGGFLKSTIPEYPDRSSINEYTITPHITLKNTPSSDYNIYWLDRTVLYTETGYVNGVIWEYRINILNNLKSNYTVTGSASLINYDPPINTGKISRVNIVMPPKKIVDKNRHDTDEEASGSPAGNDQMMIPGNINGIKDENIKENIQANSESINKIPTPNKTKPLKSTGMSYDLLMVGLLLLAGIYLKKKH